MGQAYTDRLRFKHFLRNTINQNVVDVSVQTRMMELLQAMEVSDHTQRNVMRKVVEQNRMATRSVIKWDLSK